MHWPQLLAFEVVSRQALPQHFPVTPGLTGQLTPLLLAVQTGVLAQVPKLQNCPALHALPQRPQWVVEV